MPDLVLSEGGRRIGSVSFDTATVSAPTNLTIREDPIYSFMIDRREPGMEYALWTGDIPLETRDSSTKLEQGVSVGTGFGSSVAWQDATYFDGARGRVQVKLASRSLDTPGSEWKTRLTWPIYVISTKTSEESFETMCEELRSLAAGLLFDLLSKTTVEMKLKSSSRARVFHWSSQLDLRLLSGIWEELSPALTSIFDQPYTRLGVVYVGRACYGGERLGQKAMCTLAAQGVDPRRREIPRPFRAIQAHMREDANTIEHQIIAGFLDLLAERVRDCISNIDRHIRAIEEDRPYRDIPLGGGVSLFDSVDKPRIERLRDARAIAGSLERQIQNAREAECLRDLIPHFGPPETPVFRNVESYFRLSSVMYRFLNAGLFVLDEGAEERLKSTSRLYEQWVFVQIASAFRKAGLHCVSREGMLNRVKRYRFTLDIDRGASLMFTASNGWYVTVRFEPWILPDRAAFQRRDTVFRNSRNLAWSPDVLIEFCTSPADSQRAEGKYPTVEYAVVVDAKYCRYVTREREQGCLLYTSRCV